VDIQDGIMVLIPEPDSYSEAMAGLHKEIWNDVEVKQYIAEERDAWTTSAKG
jgi:hypothetical protein